MGIVNVTPDSFSGDGVLERGGHGAAIERGLAMAAAGAAVVDVGGESTRPGHSAVPAQEELRRVLPVVSALADAGVRVSIDTYKAEVAERALEAGATMINDVWGLQRSPAIALLAARHDAELALMFNQDGHAFEGDVVEGVLARLRAAADAAMAAGVPSERILVDPGIGFGKTAEQDLVVYRRFGELRKLGHRILVGPSKKSHLGRLFGQDMPARAWGTAAAVTACVLRGADVVRVHDVAEMKAVVDVAAALRTWPTLT
jgi:dihydropteroate synthase